MGPGDLVGERFAVEHLAGSGGMGAVYRAHDRVTGAPVAIKVLHGGRKGEDRFVRETALLMELDHPGIVRYVAHGASPSGERYLVIEWLEGVDLEGHLSRGGMSVAESVMIGARIAAALAVAHRRGIVHRDIKPSNIYLVAGRVDGAKLLDFGIAHVDTLRNPTRTGALLGTPAYMAPEQARGAKDLDAGADVFSLGCVLFECLTGRPPFFAEDVMAVLAKVLLEEAPRVGALRPGVPAPLEDLVARMLAKDPQSRPRDGAALAEELERLGDLAEGDVGPVSAVAPSITTGEQRLLCVVLAREESSLDALAADDTLEIDPRRAALATDVLVAHGIGGRVEQLADGTLVATIIGAGGATEQAARGARCALALRRMLPGIPMALATGRGEVSAAFPVGAVIDRAARIVREASASGAIRLDEVTAGLLDARFDVGGDAGGLELRGEHEIAPTTRTLLGKGTPCVGRDREIGVLFGLYDECVSEPVARAVLLTGAAGIGKSRIRFEFLSRIKETSSAEVWFARGDPMSAGAPFGMIAPMIRRAAGLRDGEPLEVRRQKLWARVGRHLGGAARRRVAEFLGELIGAPFPHEESVELRAAREDAMLMGDQMRRAWSELLAAELSVSPVVIVLEDLQWGDLPSVKFFDAALRELENTPLLLLALARPEVNDLFPRLWGDRATQEIRLGELTRRSAERLVRAALGGDVGAETVERIVARAAGNAFYLEELIRAEAEGCGDSVPETVLAMVEARLERLDPSARRVLRAASVFGEVFWRGGVAALLGGTERTTGLDDRVGELTALELIAPLGHSKFSGESEHGFRHALVREAAYATLTAADRALGHRLAAEWLERAGESDAVVLAEHFERGGEPLRAIAWYRRAAAQALEGNDLGATIARVDRAIACGAEGEVLGALRSIEAEARRWRGENELGEAAASSAMRSLPHGSGAWCEAGGELALASGRLGHNHHLIALVTELESVEPTEANPQLVHALSRLAMQLFFAGKHALGSRVLARASVLERRAPDLPPLVLARLFDAHGTEALVLGDPSECLKYSELAVRESERAGDRRSACLLRSDLGYAYLEIGAYGEAERVLRDALASGERLGLPYVTAAAQSNLGVSLARQGSLDEALALERAAILAFEAQGNVRMAGASLVYLAFIELERGTLDDAERSARRAAEMLASVAPARCHALAVLARVELGRGETFRSLATAREARDLLTTLGGIDEGESAVRLIHAEALYASGDGDGARSAIAAARDRLLERAAKIRDEGRRATFVQAIPENARTIELAAAWGPGGGAADEKSALRAKRP